MYPVWPVINGARLSNMFMQDFRDFEICALIFAVCASTGAQLRLDDDSRDQSNLPDVKEPSVLIDRFAAEAERCRSMYDYRESATVEAVLVPLFLHFYYGAKNKKQTTSLLLRESVTVCQLIGLDKEETYCDLNPDEESYRRRVFWLLYVTEREYALQHGTGICLANSIILPSAEPRKNHSFSRPSKAFRNMLSKLQDQLCQQLEYPTGCSEIQRSDISITQQWFRTLVWQLSLRSVSMSSNPADHSMSLSYPAHVARDALHSISTVSFEALIAHGPGMHLQQVKIRDITNALIDVIYCVPSLSHEMSLQTRQVLHAFCCFLTRLNGYQGDVLDSLYKRLAESNISFGPFTRLPTLGHCSGYYSVIEALDSDDYEDADVV
ncbi:hypothetical protein V1506DRAFT_571563 [Lipomyces tetrasporus]